MKMNFINNAITTNANNKGAVWVVFSLFFISIFFGTTITLSQISLKQQKGSSQSINQMKLKNTSKLADYIIDRSIDDVLKNLQTNSSKPNIGFVDISSGSKIIKKDPISININTSVFSTNSNVTSLVKAPGVQGNFVINSPNKIDVKGNTIYYTFSITSIINNVVNGVNNFDSSSITVTKSISCPAPINSQGSMRAITSTELPSLSPSVSSYQFPGVYCTCVDPGFPKTGADGSCAPNVSCTLASIPNCKTCSATVANTCADCNSGYYLSSANTCLSCPTTGVASCITNSMFTCNSGYYRTSTSTSCLLCTSQVGVVTCDANTGLPITCQAGYQLVGNSCNPCLPGTYNPNVGTSACTGCSPGYYNTTSGQPACNTPCSNLGVGIASCSTIGVVTGCNAGYSLVNGACILCPTGCDSCSSAAACTSCVIGKFLYNGTCVSACSTGYYGVNGVCNVCTIPNCSGCSSATTCTSCSTSYFLYNGACVSSCPTGYYVYNSTCVSSCPTNTYLYNNNCISACPTGTYVANGNICKSCSSIAGCISCTSATSCTACYRMYLYNGTCFTSCPTGTYGNGKICSECSSVMTNCISCNSATSCTGCIAGYYASGSSCIACSAPCVNCTSATSCTSCLSGYYLSGSSCIACSAPCVTCKSATNCDSCMPGYYLKGTLIGTVYNYSCLQCATGCTSCTNPISCDPNSCAAGYYYKYSSGAYAPYRYGYYYCVPCPLDLGCTNCVVNYLSADPPALCRSCPTGYWFMYINSAGGRCCLKGCNTCTTPTYCTSCGSQYYLSGNSCYPL